MVWLYDGSFEGFLTALHRTYTLKTMPEKLTKDISALTLLDESETIATDSEIAETVSKKIATHFPRKIQERLFHIFLCDDMPFERDLLLYLRLGFKEVSLLDDLSHPIVFSVEQYQKRVLSTVHKMYAFTRFEMIEDGMLYAKIAPPRNVLPLIGRHFVKRLRSERFIIHDIQRGWINVWDGTSLQIHEVLRVDAPTLHEEEQKYQNLWRTFFDTATIESRENYKVQRNFVPLLYREFMTEFQNK